MGGSNSTDAFDEAAQEARDSTYARTGDNFQATAAATAVYARKAQYESGDNGPTPDTSVGGNLFDFGAAVYEVYRSNGEAKKN